ncbi:MAG: GNAT family N-acetyltransferase [Pseudomonadota bacterium]
MIDLRIVPEITLTPALRDGVRQLIDVSFDSATFHDVSEIETPVFRVLGLTDGRDVAAHVAVYERDVTIGGDPNRIAMLGDVAVAPALRRQGIARRAIDIAHRELKQRAIEFCVLFAYEPAVYHANGYREMTNEIRLLDRDSMWRTLVYRGSMVCALGNRPWPDDLLDLKGIVV